MTKTKINYHASVNYDQADPVKVLAQKEGAATARNMPYGFRELEGTRGESAYVFDMGDRYGALVQEGLGTKSLIAQAIYKSSGVSHFAAIAQDTVATIINDLVSVGATPVVSNAYWSASSYDWLTDTKVATDFIKGWRAACDEAGIVWGGGETQSLPGVVESGALEFAGCGFGVIDPKENLLQYSAITDQDAIVLIESSGVHANGISLTRTIADQLPDSYDTKLPDGTSYGGTLLVPTIIYSKLLQAIRDQKIRVHYASNITGHGWRKIMRAPNELTYVLTDIGSPQSIFSFIQEQSKNSTEEMYSNYNMGAGYALYVDQNDVDSVIAAAQSVNLKAWLGGFVKKGPRQVVIETLNITLKGDSLEVRA